MRDCLYAAVVAVVPYVPDFMADTKQTLPVELDLALDCRVEKADLVHEMLDQVSEPAGFTEEERLDLALAAREAVVNAMTHGCRSDTACRVHVRIRACQGEVEVWIKDTGAGFDPDAVPDPTAEENLLRTSGRGLKMMETLVDEVSFSFPADGGTEVTLRKTKRTGASHEDARERQS